jgi:hypothetical protein
LKTLVSFSTRALNKFGTNPTLQVQFLKQDFTTILELILGVVLCGEDIMVVYTRAEIHQALLSQVSLLADFFIGKVSVTD